MYVFILLNAIIMITLFFFWGGYSISTLVGYSMPNPFLYKQTVSLQTNQFSISTEFNSKKYFYFKLLSLVNSSISNNSVQPKYSFNVKTVLFLTIQLSLQK